MRGLRIAALVTTSAAIAPKYLPKYLEQAVQVLKIRTKARTETEGIAQTITRRVVVETMILRKVKALVEVHQKARTLRGGISDAMKRFRWRHSP